MQYHEQKVILIAQYGAPPHGESRERKGTRPPPRWEIRCHGIARFFCEAKGREHSVKAGTYYLITPNTAYLDIVGVAALKDDRVAFPLLGHESCVFAEADEVEAYRVCANNTARDRAAAAV